jgi:hypothetical protein
MEIKGIKIKENVKEETRKGNFMKKEGEMMET